LQRLRELGGDLGALTSADLNEYNKLLNNESSQFIRMRDALKKVAMAAIALSIMLLGYKVLMEGEAKRGMIVMYVVKVALVLYIGFGDFWYKHPDGSTGGIFPALISLPEE